MYHFTNHHTYDRHWTGHCEGGDNTTTTNVMSLLPMMTHLSYWSLTTTTRKSYLHHILSRGVQSQDVWLDTLASWISLTPLPLPLPFPPIYFPFPLLSSHSSSSPTPFFSFSPPFTSSLSLVSPSSLFIPSFLSYPQDQFSIIFFTSYFFFSPNPTKLSDDLICLGNNQHETYGPYKKKKHIHSYINKILYTNLIFHDCTDVLWKLR